MTLYLERFFNLRFLPDAHLRILQWGLFQKDNTLNLQGYFTSHLLILHNNFQAASFSRFSFLKKRHFKTYRLFSRIFLRMHRFSISDFSKVCILEYCRGVCFRKTNLSTCRDYLTFCLLPQLFKIMFLFSILSKFFKICTLEYCSEDLICFISTLKLLYTTSLFILIPPTAHFNLQLLSTTRRNSSNPRVYFISWSSLQL